MAVMQKQLNEESRVELKDTSNAPNIIDWNHGTGNAVKRINPLNRRVPNGMHEWCERTAVQIMDGLLLD